MYVMFTGDSGYFWKHNSFIIGCQTDTENL